MSRQTIVFLKSETESSDMYNDVLREHGKNVIFVTTLVFCFKNLDDLRAKLLQPDKYSGIIFNSPRSVEAVENALNDMELNPGWKLLHNYAVGELTHNLAMQNLQQLFTHGKQSGNAASLSQFIINNFDGNKERPLLIPCGNLQTDALRTNLTENGFDVETCEVYETKCNPDLAENLETALKDDTVDTLTFFSPSGFNCTYDVFKAKNLSFDKYKLVAIGPSTRRAIESKGCIVHRTAERPNVEYIVKALLETEGNTK
ncbi:uroporphyrinogen-III synthase-like [Teleopsis dalmanni]|uniref:uroporphyrinogen-III synthase-like n=1 Tax=Teleopsis dalmanni TaxID=139649 RepID=UPI0018CF4DB3|nr:uroporphyrinogen-III synthase-like [Teleopsis dalmanni]XP_037935881.1 uroporphyrinogen-III synthase-like [Teleopsis dalmanni]